MSDVILFHDLQKKDSVFARGIAITKSKGLSVPVPTADVFQFIFIITERIAEVTAKFLTYL